jgi:NAD-dependent deacetylase
MTGGVDDRVRRIEEAAELLRSAESPLVFTGAGMSRESGLRTFRGEEGLWRQYKPEELATISALNRDPKTVWEWYRERLVTTVDVRPNPGHLAIAAMESRFESLPVITQNVDGLHQEAGSTDIIELHGSLRTATCMAEPGRSFPLTPELLSTVPPLCECGSILRPDVVLFGEQLPERELMRAFRLAESSDLALVVGTSAVVYPAAAVPWTVLSNNGRVIEINPEDTPLSRQPNVIAVTGTAGETLPELMEVAWPS